MKDNFDFETEIPETPKKKSYADLDLGLDFDLSFLDDIDESVLDEVVEEPVKKAPAKKPAPAKPPVKKAAPSAEAAPVKKAAPKKPVSSEGAQPVKKAPAKKPAAQTTEAPAAAPAKKVKKPAAPQEAPVKSKKKQKKGPRVGGVIFYTLYFMFILAFFVATYFGLQWLHGWLSDYELAQPTVKAEQVFQEVFTGDIDWGSLYDSAGAEDSPYEGKEAYVAYMKRKVGDSKLTYMETSAGLSGDKKYIVSLGSEKVATFTLKDHNNVKDVSLGNMKVEDLESVADIPDWQLGAVEVFFQREEVYNIVKLNGHTAYVNGVALSEDFTIQKATTKALDYLPEGTAGASMDTQQVTGLMELPTVIVTDKDGKEMTVTYDETTKTFTERTESNTMTEEQRQAAIDAGKAYCLWMIEEINDRGKIAKHFDPSSKAYSDMISVQYERWMQNNGGYEFTSTEVTDFAGYGDNLFSARVKLMMVVTRTNGSTKDYPFEYSMFFEKQDNGKWLCFQMIANDVSAPVGKVRLTFKQGDTLLTTGFVDTDAKKVVTPNISVPEGQVFSGWITISEDAEGNTVYNLVFPHTETGEVELPDGTALEPMTLYAWFQNEGEVQEITEAPAETAPAETN